MDINELIQNCDFHSLVSSSTKLKNTKDNKYKGLSPLTSEKTPSFFLDNDTKTWYCFSSGKGGGVIDYIMEYEGLDRDGAIHFLKDFVGIEDDIKTSTNIFNVAQKEFTNNLDRAMPYLESRGISRGVAEHYGIGFCTGNDLLKQLKNFPEEEVESSGLVNQNGNIKFYDRVTIPIKNQYGKIVSFTGRAHNAKTPKYLHGPSTKYFNKKKIVWNLDKVRRDIANKDMVVVCEGQLDAIAVCEAGYPAVAMLGTSVSKEQLSLLDKLTNNVYFIFDSDEAGKNALERTFGMISDLQLDLISYAVTLPGNSDPDDFIKEHGVKLFSSYLEDAKPDTSAIIELLINKYKHNKITKSGLSFKILKELHQYTEKQFTYRSLDLIERLSQELGLDKKAIHEWFYRNDELKSSPSMYQAAKEAQFPAPVYERRILYNILNDPSLMNILEEESVSTMDFESFFVNKILSHITKEMSSVEVFQVLQEELEKEEYNKLVSFHSVGIEGDFETALKIMKLKLKEKNLTSPAVDFLGRPMTKEDFRYKNSVWERLFKEKEPF